MCSYMVLEGHAFNHGFFGWFSISFPMDFRAGAFREIPYGSWDPPEATQAATRPRGTKVESPEDQSLPGEENWSLSWLFWAQTNDILPYRRPVDRNFEFGF